MIHKGKTSLVTSTQGSPPRVSFLYNVIQKWYNSDINVG